MLLYIESLLSLAVGCKIKTTSFSTFIFQQPLITMENCAQRGKMKRPSIRTIWRILSGYRMPHFRPYSAYNVHRTLYVSHSLLLSSIDCKRMYSMENIRFGMFRHPAWAVGSYSSGPPAWELSKLENGVRTMYDVRCTYYLVENEAYGIRIISSI